MLKEKKMLLSSNTYPNCLLFKKLDNRNIKAHHDILSASDHPPLTNYHLDRIKKVPHSCLTNITRTTSVIVIEEIT